MTKSNRIIYASDAMLSEMRANAIHVMKMCSAFSKYFEKVILLCHEADSGHDAYKKYGVKDNFIIKTGLKRLPRFLSPGLKVLFSSFINACYINKNHSDDIVYGRSTFTLLFLKPSVKFIYEVHATSETGIYKIIESILLKRNSLQGLVTISNPLKKRYLELHPFLDENKIMVLHDGADSVTDFSSKINLKSIEGYVDNVKIGYIGSLYKGKCMEVMLPIAERLPNTLFHIVGGSKEWVEYWRKEACKKNINNVVFYGMVAPGDVGAYYNSFDICILPYSKNIYVDKNKRMDIGSWISPLKLFEAMSYGKPVVVSDLPSIREVMEDKKDCFLIAPDDIDSWISVLTNLLEATTLREQIGCTALQKLERLYTWEKRAETVYKYLK